MIAVRALVFGFEVGRVEIATTADPVPVLSPQAADAVTEKAVSVVSRWWMRRMRW